MTGTAPGSNDRVTLLIGRNRIAREKHLVRLLDSWLDQDWRDFNLTTAEAHDLSGSALLAAVAQVAMGDPERCRVVVLSGVERLRASESDALADVLERVPKLGRLILIAEGDRTGRDAAVSARLLRAVQAVGRVIDFPVPRPADMPAFVMGAVRDHGLTLDPDAVRELASRVGTDVAILTRELEKLATGSNGKPISRADVQALVPASAEHSIFELTDAIGERRGARAAELLRELLDRGEGPFLLLPMIARQIRLVWSTKASLDGIDGAALKEPSAAKLGDWQAQKLRRQAQAFTWPALEDAMIALYDTDLALKGINEAGEEDRALLETLLVRLCA